MFGIALVGLSLILPAAAAEVFTPKELLAAPRPGQAIPAPGGKHAVWVVSQWNPETDKTGTTVYVLDTEAKDAGAATRKMFDAPGGEVAEPLWLDDDTVAYLNGSALWSFGLGTGSPSHMFDFPEGTEPGALKYEAEGGVLAFSAAVWLEDQDLAKTGEHDEKWKDRGYSGIVYNDLFVRHWDTWRVPGRVYTVGSTKISKTGGEGKAAFKGDGAFTNLLKDTGLYSQMDAIDEGWFDISAKSLAIALKPLSINVATHTRMDVHLVPLAGGKPEQLTPGTQGAISGVVFSPKGDKVAWLEMAEDGYESDKRVVIVHTLNNGAKGESARWTDDWEFSPSAIIFAPDSDALYLLNEYHGRVKPWYLASAGADPKAFFFTGSTQSMTVLPGKHRYLLTVNSHTFPNEVYIVNLGDTSPESIGSPDKLPKDAVHQLTSLSHDYVAGRLNPSEEMWFKGDDDYDVMQFVIKPNGYTDGDKAKWPLAFLIHGGPQSAWMDQWSTRWNPAVYAAMGYFVVAPNPTGSTGYGQEFIDRITLHWGDRPFEDLLAGYRAALDEYPQIDCERTAGLGASYGGFMTNWINGHNEFGFKALVHHDGIFDLPGMYHSTEEVWFPHHDFGGPVLGNDQYDMWNPMNHIDEWETPTLVIQGAKDYRLPEAQGIATFTALQLQGVPSRFLFFPDENHWVLKAHNSLKWHDEVFGWLKEWVGQGEDKPSAEHPNVTMPIS